MKVAMVCSQVPPVYGGAGTQALALAGELVERGVEVEILTQNQLLAPRREYVGRVLIRRAPGERVARRLPRRTAQVFRTIVFSLWLSAQLSRRRYAIYHSHGNYWFALVLAVFARLRNVPLVVKVTRLGEDDIQTAMSKRFAGVSLGRLYSHPLHKADTVIALNREIADRHRATTPSVPLSELPNGVDLARFGFSSALRSRGRRHLAVSEHAKVVLFVGYLAPHKGVNELLDAWSTVTRGRAPDLVLALVGPSGGFYRELARGSDDAGRRPNDPTLRFVEHASTAEMPALYAAADVFVLPTAAEGMPNSLLEALAAGLPTVASRVPGVIEILDPQDPRTFLLDAPTAPAIAEAISAAVRNLPQRANEDGDRPPRLPERFTLSAVADQYVRIYHDLCRGNSRPVATPGAAISVSEGGPR